MSKQVFQPNAEFAKDAAIGSMDEYNRLMDKAKDNYEGFWGDYAKEKLDWIEPFTNVLDESKAPFVKWFDGGKLNVATQCIDRHLDTRKNKAAIIFEGDRGDVQTITYLDLYKNVNRFANLL
jgi:acetyl-CoA synthetase